MNKNKVLILASPLYQTGGGSVSMFKTILNGFKADNELEFEFIGSYIPFIEIFKNHKLPFKKTFKVTEFVTPLSIILFPFSIFISILNLILNYKSYVTASKIVQITSFNECIYLFPILALFKKDLILYIQGGKIPRIFKLPFIRNYVNFILKISKVIFVSNTLKTLWVDSGFTIKDHEVIYNGVASSYPNAKKSIKKSGLKFGFIGRMDSSKRLDILINSFKILKNYNNISIKIYGAGDNLSHYKQLASKYIGVLDFEFCGFVDNLAEAYNGLDVLLVPSELESFGLVLVESWSHRVMTLSSDIDVFKELTTGLNNDVNESVLLFENGSQKSFNGKLIYLIENQELFLSETNLDRLYYHFEMNFSETIFINKIKKTLIN